MTDVAVRVDHVSKSFRLYHERNQSLKAAAMRKRRATPSAFHTTREDSPGALPNRITSLSSPVAA